jgi:serine/threonine protein kinase
MMRMLETIGHYRIRRKIGEGGMGVVYEGWDERLERAVAIKTIRETNESIDARGRLWGEARSLARVNHPRVCQVFDVLEDGEALVLILELLEGQSLADRLTRGTVSPSEAVDIERQHATYKCQRGDHHFIVIRNSLPNTRNLLHERNVKLFRDICDRSLGCPVKAALAGLRHIGATRMLVTPLRC